MASYLMGLDSGLTVTKAVIFREDGTVVAMARREVAQIKATPRQVERDMTAHWQASAEAIREALAKAAEAEGAPVKPAALSVAGHGDGLYLLDKAGAPLGFAATSLDSRAQGLIESGRNRHFRPCFGVDGTAALCFVPGPAAGPSAPA